MEKGVEVFENLTPTVFPICQRNSALVRGDQPMAKGKGGKDKVVKGDPCAYNEKKVEHTSIDKLWASIVHTYRKTRSKIVAVSGHRTN